MPRPMKYQHRMSTRDIKCLSKEDTENLDNDYHSVDRFLLELQQVFIKHKVKSGWFGYNILNAPLE